MIEPYLSIVVTSRNDNHDGSLLYRMNIFIKVLCKHLANYPDFPVELIIIEWNPPSQFPTLSSILPLNKISSNLTIRIINVPNQIHNRIANSIKIPLFQFIAKNVGIRRARGKFVLCTNIDVLFSQALFVFLQSCDLRKNEFVRTVRFDVPQKLPDSLELNKILSYCNSHLIRAFWPWGTEELIQNNTKLHMKLLRMIKLKLYKGIFTNACGDFTLMAKNYWFKLRGYPEYPLHGVKLDSLLLHAAISYGLNQVILPENMCVYHIDHPRSWTSAKSKGLFEYYQHLGIPTIEHAFYLKLINKMQSDKKPVYFNNYTWGFFNKNFHERLIET